jgi:hypothetical protein
MCGMPLRLVLQKEVGTMIVIWAINKQIKTRDIKKTSIIESAKSIVIHLSASKVQINGN